MMRRALTAVLVLVVLLGASSAYGRWSIRVTEGEVTTEFLVSDIDSITFHDSTPQMVAVPAGTFTMGDPGAYCADEHEVQLTRGLYLGQHEVTNKEYTRALQWAFDSGHVTASSVWVRDTLDGSIDVLLVLSISEVSFSGDAFSCVNQDNPVVGVTWCGAARYCDWLSLQSGLPRAYEHSGDWLCNGHNPYGAEGYRLPTDAEWEYAAQYDDERIYPWANEPPDCSRANFIHDGQDCVGSTSPVGSYPDAPASLGLSDMAGNVFEWCNDWHQCNLGATAEEDPAGPETGTLRGMRGGSWNCDSDHLRCAYRDGGFVGAGYNWVGFRVARSSIP